MSHNLWPDPESRARVRQQVATEYQDGDSLRMIGMRHGCSYSTVRTLLREADVTLRPQGLEPGAEAAGARALRHMTPARRSELRTTLAARHADGLTREDLALLYGLPVGAVRRLLAEAEAQSRRARPTADV
jgi:transposase